MATYTVSGAGDATVNGDYVESGTANGKPVYHTASFSIYWNGSAWGIVDRFATTDRYYSNAATGATPPHAGWTTATFGTAPAPTLALVGSNSGFFLLF